MYKRKTFFAIIPARGGSKRLPGKNGLSLAKKPLIVWTIESVKKSKYIDEAIVSTDNQKIANIARRHGAKLPFLRPKELATDVATSFSVLKHAIEFYLSTGKSFDFIIMLQPTAPLRDSKDIDRAIESLMNKDADSLVSVCEVEQHPLRSNTLPKDLSMNNFLRPDAKDKTIQELPAYYRLNGAIHICRINEFLKQKTFFLNDKVFAYIMPKEKSFDIDTLLDFKMAELLMKQRIKDEKNTATCF